jgi:hypothetical protein
MPFFHNDRVQKYLRRWDDVNRSAHVEYGEGNVIDSSTSYATTTILHGWSTSILNQLPISMSPQGEERLS